MYTSRRGFIKGAAGLSALGMAGCCCCGGKVARVVPANGKIRLAAVGVMGKGYSDWMPMVKSGLAELVAWCDADATMREKAINAKDTKKIPGLAEKLAKIPFYTDYRKMLDEQAKLQIDAMTISTPDHMHAAVAIRAMKMGIHVYVQKPLVRTLWELDYFNKTAKECGVVTQMGNQGSSVDSMRRCTEVLQSGILGDVKEVHVWTNRPVWPQGKNVEKWVKGHPNGDPIRNGLDWNAWLGVAAKRPFLDRYPDDADVYDPWKLGKNVYHTFTWRGFFDFGCGAFGDMACHTMNLPFRGLELGAVSDAICTKIESENDVAYPLKSVVKLTYKERESNARPGVKLPAVTLYWYDGDIKPDAALMPKWAATHEGKVPNTGCYIIGSKGAVLMQDDYGAKCAIALNDDKEFKDIFAHEAAKQVARVIPFRAGSSAAAGKASVEMKGFGTGHYIEFLDAIRGVGPVYAQTHSRCFSDVDYSIPQMEGILVGCIAQRLPNQMLKWCSSKQTFDVAAANAFIKPYIRKGFEF